MTVVTPNDAYTLALIARWPNLNGDLVDELSAIAKPIGKALIAKEEATDPKVAEITRQFRAWAKKGSKKKTAKR